MSKLPHTDSIGELARFWDVHDLTEYEDELEEVDSQVFERPLGAFMTVTLPPEEIESLARLARSRGLDQADLVREWVLEKLHDAVGSG